MRAVVVAELGRSPAVADREEPPAGAGSALLELRAAGLNPVDLAIASGRFPAGSPPPPYVPGVEGVGVVRESSRLAEGTRVYVTGRGLGVGSDGSFSEVFAASDETLIEVPDEVDDVLAAALGVPGLAAWMPLRWLAPVREDDRVLVLGATGTAGSVAVQAARILGAERVVAAGRNAERLSRTERYGADATVSIEDESFQDTLGAAFAGAGPTIVVDLLFGPPLEAAVAVAAPGARILHIGQSAGPSATLLSGHIRGKQLRILGYSNFAVPQDELASGYRELVGHATAGRIRVDLDTMPLDRVAEAWQRQASGSGVKLVLVP